MESPIIKLSRGQLEVLAEVIAEALHDPLPDEATVPVELPVPHTGVITRFTMSHVTTIRSFLNLCREQALECRWMTVREARQAIPPAYTKFIGNALMKALGRAA